MSAPRWIMFMPTIPARPATVRVRIWRRLQAIGAINLRGAVYVLPNRDDCVELFTWLSRELVSLGGQASLCEGRFVDGSTDDDIHRRFVDARNADYAEIEADAKALAARLKKRRSADKLAAATVEHAKLARRLADITAIDYVEASGREAAESQLQAVARALPRDPGAPDRDALNVVPRPTGATWVTRTGVHVDRIACAWLIRRFIDPKASFKFVHAKGYVPEPGELRFDMFNAEFTHVGDRCSYEVLCERMAIGDPGVLAIGEIVHDLDLRDDLYKREETAGVRGVIDGICSVARDDDARITAALPMLDGLHSHFTRTARRDQRARKR